MSYDPVVNQPDAGTSGPISASTANTTFQLTGISILLNAGNYIVTWAGKHHHGGAGGAGTNNSECQLFYDGGAIGNRQLSADDTVTSPQGFCCQARVTVDGAKLITGEHRLTGGVIGTSEVVDSFLVAHRVRTP